jgi:translation initiation factor eIF-2B subunit alpha
LKTELVKQGKNYAAEALGYRDKIAGLSLGFIKDDSVVGVLFRDDYMVWY